MREQLAKGKYWVFQNGRRTDLWIIDPTGDIVDQVASMQQGESICEELNRIKKPTPEQLNALIAVVEADLRRAGIRR